jgi:hypothetical protein
MFACAETWQSRSRGQHVNFKHTPARTIRASWEFDIIPGEPEADKLYEDAPIDQTTRAIFRLVEPIRKFLAEHEHRLSVDRGDFGDGDEFFYVTLYDEGHAEAFSQLCDSLRA